MDTESGLFPTFYEELLDLISYCEIGQKMHVSHVAYECSRSLYERAVKEGYLIDNYSYDFTVAKKPSKNYDERTINSYFGWLNNIL